MTASVSSASVVGLSPAGVSASVAAASSASAASSAAVPQAAQLPSAGVAAGAPVAAQVNDFESVLSPLLATGMAVPTPAGNVSGAPGDMHLEALQLAAGVTPGTSLPIKPAGTSVKGDGSALPADGNCLPDIDGELLGKLTSELNALKARGETPTGTGEHAVLEDSLDTGDALVGAEDLAALSLPMDLAVQTQKMPEQDNTLAGELSVPAGDATMQSAIITDSTADMPAAETALPSPMASSIKEFVANDAQQAARAAIPAALNVTSSTATLVTPSGDIPLDTVAPTDASTGDAAAAGLASAVVSADAPTDAVSDKSVFGRLLESSRLADAVPGTSPDSASVAVTSLGKSAAGAVAYRMDGQETIASTLVTQPFGADGWDNEVGERVAWFTSNRIQHAEIELDPPELGPLQVRISTQNDQTTVSFTSHHAAVREVLDQNLPKLKELFAEQGLNLVQADVSERRSAQQDSANGGSSERNPATADADEDIASAEQEVNPATSTVRRGLVDAFA